MPRCFDKTFHAQQLLSHTLNARQQNYSAWSQQKVARPLPHVVSLAVRDIAVPPPRRF
jgi:hypothetical protein